MYFSSRWVRFSKKRSLVFRGRPRCYWSICEEIAIFSSCQFEVQRCKRIELFSREKSRKCPTRPIIFVAYSLLYFCRTFSPCGWTPPSWRSNSSPITSPSSSGTEFAFHFYCCGLTADTKTIHKNSWVRQDQACALQTWIASSSIPVTGVSNGMAGGADLILQNTNWQNTGFEVEGSLGGCALLEFYKWLIPTKMTHTPLHCI